MCVLGETGARARAILAQAPTRRVARAGISRGQLRHVVERVQPVDVAHEERALGPARQRAGARRVRLALGWAALWFSGPDIRRVDTVPLDMRHGGRAVPDEACAGRMGRRDREMQVLVGPTSSCGRSTAARTSSASSSSPDILSHYRLQRDLGRGPRVGVVEATIFRRAQPILSTTRTTGRSTTCASSTRPRRAAQDVPVRLARQARRARGRRVRAVLLQDGRLQLYPDPLELDSVGFPGGCGDVIIPARRARGARALPARRRLYLLAGRHGAYNWGYRFFRAYCIVGLGVCAPRCCRRSARRCTRATTCRAARSRSSSTSSATRSGSGGGWPRRRSRRPARFWNLRSWSGS